MITGEMIDEALAKSPVKEGSRVRVDGVEGIVLYVYYNGYALVEFPDTPITGGILNNNSTYKWNRLEVITNA